MVGAAPFLGAAAVGFGVVAGHNPEADLSHSIKGAPQVTAECIQRNAAMQPARLAAVVQPMHGNETWSVVLKRGGVTGDPIMTVLIQEAITGSRAEFRPLTPEHGDLVARMLAGC
jgi:hypothetical protein